VRGADVGAVLEISCCFKNNVFINRIFLYVRSQHVLFQSAINSGVAFYLQSHSQLFFSHLT